MTTSIRLRPRTLGGRLVLALAGFGSLITAAVVTIDYRISRDRMLLQTEQALDDRARDAAARIERALIDRVRAVDMWPRLEAAQELAADDVDKRLSLTLQQFVRGLGDGDVAVGTDTTGRVVAASRPDLINERLDTLSGLTDLSVAAPFAFVPAQPARGRRARLVFAREARMRDVGRPLGRLVLVSDWTTLVERSDLPFGTTGLLELRDPHGNTIYEGEVLATSEPSLLVRGRYESRVFPHFPLTVIVAEPRTSALAPVRRARLASLVLGASLIAVIVPAAAVVAGGATRALRRLTAAARETSGDIPPRFALDDAAAVPDEVRVLNDALDRMVERLERSRRELAAQQTLASLGTMAATLAHEIRTPLGVVRGSLALLSRPGADDARRAELREMVETEVARLERLVDELLAFARPRSPAREPGDLADLCRRIIPVLQSQCTPLGVTLELDLEPAPAKFDADQLVQVVLNLVANAAQATPRGGRVVVRTVGGSEGPAIVVEDFGSGMTAEVLQRVWEPFVTTRRGGTGLGLPIVKRIVDAHGGRVAIHSERGRGTTVRVVLDAGEIS